MEIGIKGKVETVVDGSNTAKFVGSGSLDVFATPCMVGLMEQAAQMSVAPYLAEEVWAESELIEIDRRRLVFEVKAFDECGQIGAGRHERFIINNEKFIAKANAKGAK